MTGIRVDSRNRTARKIPAEGGIWVFVALDVLIFAWMFGIYGYQRAVEPDAFREASQAITQAFGLAYTILLLTSSWCVVTSIAALKRAEFLPAGHFISWGMRFGIAFVLLKLVEYGVKFSNGYLPVTNEFLMFYFVLTFVHLLHVCGGLVALGFVRHQILSGERDETPVSPDRLRLVEAAGIFWHMVDLLWIFLFALFYLGG